MITSINEFRKIFENNTVDKSVMDVARQYVNKSDDYFEDLIGCDKTEALEEPGLCSTVSHDFEEFAAMHAITLSTITIPIAEKFWIADPTGQYGEMIKDHTANLLGDDTVIDLTLRQFGKQFDCPYIDSVENWKRLISI